MNFNEFYRLAEQQAERLALPESDLLFSRLQKHPWPHSNQLQADERVWLNRQLPLNAREPFGQLVICAFLLDRYRPQATSLSELLGRSAEPEAASPLDALYGYGPKLELDYQGQAFPPHLCLTGRTQELPLWPTLFACYLSIKARLAHQPSAMLALAEAAYQQAPQAIFVGETMVKALRLNQRPKPALKIAEQLFAKAPSKELRTLLYDLSGKSKYAIEYSLLTKPIVL